MKEKIGGDAGYVWKILNEQGIKSIKELRELTKLTEKEIYAAVGWLSREEKLIFERKGTDIMLSLTR
ncbi:MAG: winged helix-turn-helix domain-containing protein [Dysgonamonadaceae bacterium]|jgi:hypothetical protein|nr:winged helix-turn-helix domain-containing protein [Dysgonamonadaceae bacterium]